MLKNLRALVALAVLSCGMGGAAWAQDEMQPLLMLSFKGFEELQKDLDYIGELSDNPDMGAGLEGIVGLLTGGQDLEGFDRSKPWGAAVSSDGVEFQILAFLPIKDTEQFLQSVGAIAGAPQDEGDGVWKLDAPGMALYFKGHNGWTYVSLSPDFLTKLPDDPQTLLKGLDTKHDLSLQMNVQNIPEIFRQMAMEQVKQGLNQQLEAQGGSGGPGDVVRQLAEKQFDSLGQSMNDVDVVSFGGSIDPEAKKGVLDITTTAREGTEMAKQMKANGEMKSLYSGFQLDDAAACMNLCMNVSSAEADQLKGVLADLKEQLFAQANLEEVGADDNVKKMAKDLVDRLFGVVESTFSEGKVDAGMALVGEGPFTLLAGGFNPKSEELQKVVEDLAKTLETELGFYGFQLDVAKHEDVRFHSVAVPLPGGEIGDQLTALFGFDLELTFGVGPQSVFVAMGKDGVDHLKKVLDQSKSAAGEPAQPIRGHIKVAPLVKLMDEMRGDAAADAADQAAAMGAALSEVEAGKDKITINSKSIERGMTIHVEAEEGLLKILPGLVTSIGLPAGIGGF